MVNFVLILALMHPSQALTAVSPDPDHVLHQAVASKEPTMAAEVLSCLSEYLSDSEVRKLHGMFFGCWVAFTRSYLACHCTRSHSTWKVYGSTSNICPL